MFLPKLLNLSKNILAIGIFRILSSLVTTLSIPIITRIYSPEQYAEWILWLSASLLIASVATLCYDLSVVLPREEKVAANLFVASIGISFIVGILTLIILLVVFSMTTILKEWSNEEQLIWLISMPLYLFLYGMSNTINAWFVRKKTFNIYAISQLLAPTLTLIIQAALGTTILLPFLSLVLGSVLGQLGANIVAFRIVMKNWFHEFKESLDSKKMYSAMMEYRVYPIFMAPYHFLGTIRERLIYFVLGKSFSKTDVGFYGMSQKVSNIPANLLASAVRPVFYQKAASHGMRDMEQIITNMMILLSIFIIPGWVLFLFNCNQIFGFVFGEQWKSAGIYAAILSFAVIPHILECWLDRTFDVKGRQRLLFFIETFFSVIVVSAVLASSFIYKSVLHVIIVQAGLTTIYFWFFLYMIFLVAHFDLKNYLKIVFSVHFLMALYGSSMILFTFLMGNKYGTIVYIIFALVSITIYLKYRISDIKNIFYQKSFI